jgi:DNA-binding NtrC family response regulator
MVPHILFVDDEAPIRELLSLSFRKKGWEVTTATSAAQARSVAAKAPFTLAAALDVNLAEENGLDLLTSFKTNHPNVTVLIFTGLNEDNLAERALAQGASGFMSKTESPQLFVSGGLSPSAEGLGSRS